MGYKNLLRYSPSTDYMVYNGSFWEESKPKPQGVSQDLTERQLAEAETEMKKSMDELVKNGGMEILVSVGPKKAVQMFNKQQAHAYEMYEDASVYKKYAIKRRDTKNIAATLKEARPMLEVEQRNLDADEFMLNTPTLTYNLRQGIKFPMEHRPEHFITKQTTVDPSSDGADIWASALDTFFLKDTDLIDYVQRMAELQEKLVLCVNKNAEYDVIANEIDALREKKAAVVTKDAEQEMLKKRIEEMRQFLRTQSRRVTEYDEQMVRRLIEKITVFDNNLIFEFKSGMTLELKR